MKKRILKSLLALVITVAMLVPFMPAVVVAADEDVTYATRFESMTVDQAYQNMQTIKFDLNTTYGPFKMMNATNGGPWYKRHVDDQRRSNFKTYKEARIPYARNHDSWFHSVYGGPYAHDIVGIFPNFDADENDPKSYLFKNTDESILATLAAGTKTFYRLGHSIEHYIEKRNTLPPKDFHKWARI